MPPGMTTKSLSKSEIEEFLKSQRIGVLALNDGKTSYAVPLAYSYDKDTVYLAMGSAGRKTGYIKSNQNVCFCVYVLAEGYPAKRGYTSVICDGVISRITDAEELRERGRASEKAMGMPPGAMNERIEKTIKDPANSVFWKVSVNTMGGKKAEDA